MHKLKCMAKISIEGVYHLTGNHLIRQTDRQLIEVQPNPAKPKKGARRFPKDLLILIKENGERVRLSGLFEVSTAGSCPEWSCDVEGVNYRIRKQPDQTAVIVPAGAKKQKPEKVGRVLTFSGKKLAAACETSMTNQLNLW